MKQVLNPRVSQLSRRRLRKQITLHYCLPQGSDMSMQLHMITSSIFRATSETSAVMPALIKSILTMSHGKEAA